MQLGFRNGSLFFIQHLKWVPLFFTAQWKRKSTCYTINLSIHLPLPFTLPYIVNISISMLGHCKGFTSLHSNPAQQRSSVSTCSLADNVARLPSTASVRRIQVLSSFPSSIENVPGKHASVAIYTFLARKYSGA